MFFSSFRAPLAALIAYVVAFSAAPAVSATPSLAVKASISNLNVDGVKNLKVTTTVVNTGGKTLKLLNDPRGVLNPFPENSFTISNPAGSPPAFNGARAMYIPTHAAGLDDPGVFTVLAPGDSIGITHDLSAAYDFTRSGAGNYSIEPSNLFTYIDADGTPNDFHATIEGLARVRLSGGLAISRHVHDKRAPFKSCSARRRHALETASIGAQISADESYSYITHLERNTRRYKTWFGRWNVTRKAAIQEVFRKLSKETDFSKITYDCSCKETSMVNYIKHDTPGTIWLCRPFWEFEEEDQDGGLIHAAVHSIIGRGSKDFAYGEGACRALAAFFPQYALINADNFRLFTQDEPKDEPELEYVSESESESESELE